MSNVIRVNLRKILSNENLLDTTRNVKLIRTVTSRTTRAGQDLPLKPKPWPYQTKGYTILNYFFDRTTARLDENSKVFNIEKVEQLEQSRI